MLAMTAPDDLRSWNRTSLRAYRRPEPIRIGEAPVVHDDDGSRTWNIDPSQEPQVRRPPRDNRIRDLILDMARTHPNWGRLRIYEELRDRGHDLNESEVNYVLDKHHLPNSQR
jgi:hypothetical protein